MDDVLNALCSHLFFGEPFGEMFASTNPVSEKMVPNFAKHFFSLAKYPDIGCECLSHIRTWWIIFLSDCKILGNR